jgi:small subunit ribosomal protein S5
VGLGKSGDTPLAVDKAVRAAKKNMVTINLKNGTISHRVEAKYSSARVSIMKAPGKGVVAGGSVRNVLELVGAKEVSAKILSRSKNKINNARAAIKALETLNN